MGVQFRSRFVLSLLSTFDTVIDLEFHNMETFSGKEPMNGAS